MEIVEKNRLPPEVPRGVVAAAEARCLVRPSTVADMQVVTGIYGRFVETSTATSEIRRPSEAEMLNRRQIVLAMATALPWRIPFMCGRTAPVMAWGRGC